MELFPRVDDKTKLTPSNYGMKEVIVKKILHTLNSAQIHHHNCCKYIVICSILLCLLHNNYIQTCANVICTLDDYIAIHHEIPAGRCLIRAKYTLQHVATTPNLEPES